MYRSAPCIMSRADLEHEIERNEWHLEQPEQELDGTVLFDARHKAEIREDLQELKAILARLAGEPCVIDGEVGETMPSVHVGAEFINRAVAEHALREMVKALYGIALCRFKWHRPKLISIPA